MLDNGSRSRRARVRSPYLPITNGLTRWLARSAVRFATLIQPPVSSAAPGRRALHQAYRQALGPSTEQVLLGKAQT